MVLYKEAEQLNKTIQSLYMHLSSKTALAGGGGSRERGSSLVIDERQN
jgi:hypothetical protein